MKNAFVKIENIKILKNIFYALCFMFSLSGCDGGSLFEEDIESSSTYTSIGLGEEYSCAVKTDGTLACWGSNTNSTLGIVGLTSTSVPVDVTTILGVSSVYGSRSHTCALTVFGVGCWGDNSYGQLGEGTTINQPVPGLVFGLPSNVVEVSLGDTFTCARTTTSVYCWGDNTFWFLGDGTQTDSLTPVSPTGLSSVGVISISSKYKNSCAVLSSGSIRCWGGSNSVGEHGNGTTSSSTTPVSVSGIATATKVVVGRIHSCALLADGTVSCWGIAGANGSGLTSSTPVSVAGLSNIDDISAGNDHNCALTDGGGVKCWGDNFYGQLGNGSTVDSASPVNVVGLESGVKAISLGVVHSCALKNAGSVVCWGLNSAGQLGNGTVVDSSVPVTIINN